MSSSGSHPPPLPPRSPRPGSDVLSNPYEHYPPLPPARPPPRSPGLSPDIGSPPPPIPPRPPGFEINTSVHGNDASSRPQSIVYMPPSLNGQAYMSFQLPPPPSPPPGSMVPAYSPSTLSPCPQQQQHIPGPSPSRYTHTVQSSWGSGAQSPNTLTTFPPPPPGPPPRNPNKYSTSAFPQYQPASPAPVSTHTNPQNPVPSFERIARQASSSVYQPRSETPSLTPLDYTP
ncbi:hypothetical protein F5X99DRAFT_262495 [Biscogniauxia marginata]|nr:hypothetical protein F5X99DRAFT_262495 [Biscogniauxia marginata]